MLLLCLLSTILCATSRAGEPLYELDIPALNVAEALNRFAEQTGAIMLFPYDLASARQANAVRGRYSLLQGLDLLLRRTGLSGGLSDKRVVSISRSGNDRRSGEGTMAEQKTGLAGRVVAFIASMFSAAGVSAQDPDPATGSLEEIIVTAQKREERLTDVPISISVLSGADLDESTAQGMTQILNSVPGVATTVATQGGGTLVAVRGVAAGLHVFAGSSPVGYYLDSVPFGFVRSALAPDANPYDLDHVEVLRGPQGTLYGASALNGVVRVLTNDANPDKFELKARTELSYTDKGGENYRGDAAINVPIIDGKLAARAVVGYQELSGWIDKPLENDANDASIRTMRLKIAAQPTDQLSLDAFIWLSRSDFGAPSLSIDGEHRVTSLQREPISADYDISSLKIGYDFSVFTLTGMTSYIDYTDDSDFDIDVFVNRPSTILQTINHSKAFSQELVFNSTHDGPWRWTFGGIYRDVEDRTWQLHQLIVSPIDHTDTSESFAVFGELTREFFDGRLEITAGLRHFEDENRYIEHSRSNGAPANQLFNVESEFDATTPRYLVSWHPQERLTVYASYSEGFRSGVPQTANVLVTLPDFPPMQPDLLKNYELGTKGSLAGGRFQFDAALFYIDWQDVQQVLTVPTTGGTSAPALINAPSASGVGFEFGLDTELADGLTVGANFSWNDLQTDSDVVSGGLVLFTKGERLAMSPEYTGSMSAQYAFPVGRGGYEGRISASANYTSSQGRRIIVANNLRVFNGDSILTGRTSFSLDSPNRWSASLFVDNITGEDGAIFWWQHPADWAWRPRPRTIGLQFDYRH